MLTSSQLSLNNKYSHLVSIVIEGLQELAIEQELLINLILITKTNTVFNVDHVAIDRISHGKKPGPDPYLTTDEEAKLCHFLIETSDYGYRRTRREVKKLYTIPAN